MWCSGVCEALYPTMMIASSTAGMKPWHEWKILVIFMPYTDEGLAGNHVVRISVGNLKRMMYLKPDILRMVKPTRRILTHTHTHIEWVRRLIATSEFWMARNSTITTNLGENALSHTIEPAYVWCWYVPHGRVLLLVWPVDLWKVKQYRKQVFRWNEFNLELLRSCEVFR